MRIGALVACALVLAVLRHGFDIFDPALLGLTAIWGSSAYLIGKRLSRPARTYGYFALASSVIAAVFIGIPATNHSDPTIGIIGWAGVTILGLIWCIYYERTATAR